LKPAETAAQTAAFFQEEAQMGISNPTVAQIQAEGITNVQDLADLNRLQGNLWLEPLMNVHFFRDDNASVYHYLEEATRSTAYEASIKLFQRRKDGRGALLALLGQ
jgi:hypothetical protein